MIYRKPRLYPTLHPDNSCNWSMSMNRTDFSLYRGTDNSIEILVRDPDRKPVKLNGSTITMILSGYPDRLELLTKNVNITDYDRGIGLITFSEMEINQLPIGTACYSIKISFSDGMTKYLATDYQENAIGYLKIMDGIIKLPEQPPKVIHYTPIAFEQPKRVYQVTPTFEGNLRNGRTNTYTITTKMDNWYGEMIVQGTIDPVIPTEEENWDEIVRWNISGNQDAHAFIADMTWYRVLYRASDNNEGKLITTNVSN